MKVIVSAVAFSKNKVLVDKLRSYFPDAIVNDEGIRYVGEDLITYYQGADAIITGLEKIDAHLLERLPNLKLVAKYGVGLDNIDIAACNKKGVKIGWVGGVNKHSVAEMTLGFMLMLCRNLYLTSNQLKKGRWNKIGGFSLAGKTIGIIGLGNIGKELVRILSPFNVKIIANDCVDVSDFALKNKVELVSKEFMYKNADIITLHTPLDTSTKDLINRETIDSMKKDVFLINTARGGIINENDLKWALTNHRIAGAALDVFTVEPPEDIDLVSLPNLICTPHIAGNAYEAVLAMGEVAIQSIVDYKKIF